SNLRAVNAALIGQDAAIWPWGWRLPLALAAAAAYSGQWERTILRPGLPAGILTAAGTALTILGGYLWLFGYSLSWLCFLSAGLALATPALAPVVSRRTIGGG
ncbi:MAG: hypothetical protein N2512_08130, partial [Armatimonadetes bacterium]|nr:hypothetical protein [Armatimonadota bacterium]